MCYRYRYRYRYSYFPCYPKISYNCIVWQFVVPIWEYIICRKSWGIVSRHLLTRFQLSHWVPYNFLHNFICSYLLILPEIRTLNIQFQFVHICRNKTLWLCHFRINYALNLKLTNKITLNEFTYVYELRIIFGNREIVSVKRLNAKLDCGLN